MDLNTIRKEREKWMRWKNIAPIYDALQKLKKTEVKVTFGDTIKIKGEYSDPKEIETIAKLMKPWRKGPFEIFGTFIDSEWRSYIKYNLLRPHFDLKNKRVADIGCNNGYYMFRFLEEKPKKIVGFDPSPLFKLQFEFFDYFIQSGITYELLGVEHAEFYNEKFDTIFCLGVLYHRSDPINMLKQLYRALDSQGEVFLDTFYIEGEDEIALCPAKSYSKISNVHFVPTIKTLENWCKKAGFNKFFVLEKSKTTPNEQRKTEWIEGESLEDFLNPVNPEKTVEGYPAPRRVYVKLVKHQKQKGKNGKNQKRKQK